MNSQDLASWATGRALVACLVQASSNPICSTWLARSRHCRATSSKDAFTSWSFVGRPCVRMPPPFHDIVGPVDSRAALCLSNAASMSASSAICQRHMAKPAAITPRSPKPHGCKRNLVHNYPCSGSQCGDATRIRLIDTSDFFGSHMIRTGGPQPDSRSANS